MPKYLDHHELKGSLRPEAIKQMVSDIRAGKTDQFGVKSINSFFAKNEAWCLTEAPNREAVHKTHEVNYGIKLGPGDVTEVQTLV